MKRYEAPEIVVTAFTVEDVVTTSDPVGGLLGGGGDGNVGSEIPDPY